MPLEDMIMDVPWSRLWFVVDRWSWLKEIELHVLYGVLTVDYKYEMLALCISTIENIGEIGGMFRFSIWNVEVAGLERIPFKCRYQFPVGIRYRMHCGRKNKVDGYLRIVAGEWILIFFSTPE